MKLGWLVTAATLVCGLLASPAVADAAHDAACATALAEARVLKDDIGVWRAKARVLASRHTDKHSAAVAADLDSMTKDHRVEELVLDKRLTAATQGEFTLHQGGACPQDADTQTAILDATRFMNMPDHPSIAPLPDGYCRNSPDMSAPLVACAKKPMP
ncbi:MAG: hypothetical protein ABI740_02475 [Alphaproteobacteria bacterium]